MNSQETINNHIQSKFGTVEQQEEVVALIEKEGLSFEQASMKVLGRVPDIVPRLSDD